MSMPVKSFKQLDELKTWLVENGINISVWGTGNAKNISNLWHEYIGGEITLWEHPPLRMVAVVQIKISQEGYYLVEAVQELANGRQRSRNQPPSEKIKPGEHYTEAAWRCLKEELGLAKQAVSFDHTTYRQVEKRLDSPSYPGLPTQYLFHIIEAYVAGLPSTSFWRENASYGAGDPVKRHYWKWQKRKQTRL